MSEMTAKEAARLTGRSVTWLETHTCGWCDREALQAVRNGCGAIYGKDGCDPVANIRKATPRSARTVSLPQGHGQR